MVFGSRQPPPLHWKLESDTIQVVEQHFHLGSLHSTKSTIARTILQTSRGRSSFFALNRLWYQVWLHSSTHSLEALPSFQLTLHVVWCMTVEYLQDRDGNV